MSKRTVYTTVTPLPPGITRETVMACLHDHYLMIDLNPLVEERHPIKAPPNASPEEFHCQWYSLTDRVQYLPGGMASGKVSYNACFHDLSAGVQIHVYAPLGLNIREKWSLGGNLPGEPVAPAELGVGVPLTGLYLREDIDMKCNFMLTTFVKGNLKRSHGTLVDRMVAKAKLTEVERTNESLGYGSVRGGTIRGEGSVIDFDERSRRRVESWAEGASQSVSPQQSQVGGSSSRGSEYDDEESLRPRPLSIMSNSTNQSGSRSGWQGQYQSHQQVYQQGQLHGQRPSQSHGGNSNSQYQGQGQQGQQGYAAQQQSPSMPTLVELPQADHQEKKVYEMA